MPRIVLRPMPVPPIREGAITVGTADGFPFSYEGRQAFIDGLPVGQDAIGSDLLQAVEDALSPVFGGDWSTPLKVLSGLNPRSVNRDRIVKRGLPVDTLIVIGRVSELGADLNCPRAAGDLVLGLARLADQRAMGTGFGPVTTKIPNRTEMLVEADVILRRAVDIVADYRTGRINLDRPT